MKLLRALVAGSSIVALSSLLAPSHTEACGNEIDLRLTSTGLVAEGEKLVADGKAQGAHDHVKHIATAGGWNSPLSVRAWIVIARAVVRSDGEIAIPTDGPPKAPPKEGGDTERVKNLRDAAAVLERVLQSKPEDPSAQTDLAEALARIPGREAEAKKMLEALEAKNVVASAWGYAALSQLRIRTDKQRPGWLAAASLASEQASRVVSLERCAKMATRKELCSGEKLEDAMKPVPLPAPARAGGRMMVPSRE